MRKYILTALLLLSAAFSFGQEKMIIHLADGTTKELDVWQIDRITFGDVTPVSVNKPTADEAVDLGLSVKWAPYNFGASKSTAPGLLVGWADPTGTVKSSSTRFYPSDNPPSDIIGTKLDIVTSLWGEGWRLPSDEEFKELLEQCTWEAVKTTDDTLTGFNVSHNNNTIFIPVTGYREGVADATNTTAGYYWTGILDTYQRYAKALIVDADGQKVDTVKRSYGLAIRPVYGPYYHVSFSDINVANITTNSADVSVKFTGTLDAYDKFVLTVSSKEDLSDTVAILPATSSELSDGSYTYKVTGLEYNTPYYYQISAVRGDNVKKSAVAKFSTAYTHMNFSLSSATNITKSSTTIGARFDGTFDRYSEIGLMYSTDQNFGSYVSKKISSTDLDDEGNYVFSLESLNYNTTYFYKLYALGVDSTVTTAYSNNVMSFTTQTKYSVEAVDLGLPSGLKWAKYNLGATAENEVGLYFKWADGNEQYSNKTEYGWQVQASPADIAGTDYDVAHNTLGDQWHIPDSLDFLELKQYCDWTWGELTTPDNQTLDGWYVSNPNDASKRIFLPYTGNLQSDLTPYMTSSASFYWTADNHNGLDATYFTFRTSPKYGARVTYGRKNISMPIRPVYGAITSQKPVVIDSTQISQYDNNAVDLGLSVLWSSCDLDASSVSSDGSLYAWGELTGGKESYTGDTYQYTQDYDATNNGYTYIGDDISGTQYDAAKHKWGGNWRMPTDLEYRELLEDCNWEWDSANSRFKITSTINGNSLYWYVRNGEDKSYWLSNLYSQKDDIMYNTSSYFFNIRGGGSKPNYATYNFRYFGMYIRPVKDRYRDNK